MAKYISPAEAPVKILHRMILRMLPGPFLGAFGTLMFLLFMQFLMRHLADLVGRGLPTSAILELITYNLAYMVVLAVPMSVLLAVIATFARLSETGAYVVMRSAGISLIRLMWPAVAAGTVVMIAMTWFNNVTLPDTNYLAAGLWQDIRQKKPGFALEPGVFYEGVPGYSIRAMEIDVDSNALRDVTIYDYSEGTQVRTSINATGGTLESSADNRHILLTVFEGEIHRLHVSARTSTSPQRYEMMRFGRLFLPLDVSQLAFERSDPGSTSRSDRTMRTEIMLAFVDSLRDQVETERAEFLSTTIRLGRRENLDPLASDSGTLPDTPESTAGSGTSWDGQGPDPGDWNAPLASLDTLVQNEVFDIAMQRARSVQTDLENIEASMAMDAQRADRYMVEVHKKFSIAVACLVFVLIGAPLVVILKRGSIGFVTALSAGIFVFYWVTLVLGEKMSDRGDLRPWVGMWIANMVIGVAAVWLLLVVYRVPSRLRRRLSALLANR